MPKSTEKIKLLRGTRANIKAVVDNNKLEDFDLEQGELALDVTDGYLIAGTNGTKTNNKVNDSKHIIATNKLVGYDSDENGITTEEGSGKYSVEYNGTDKSLDILNENGDIDTTAAKGVNVTAQDGDVVTETTGGDIKFTNKTNGKKFIVNTNTTIDKDGKQLKVGAVTVDGNTNSYIDVKKIQNTNGSGQIDINLQTNVGDIQGQQVGDKLVTKINDDSDLGIDGIELETNTNTSGTGAKKSTIRTDNLEADQITNRDEDGDLKLNSSKTSSGGTAGKVVLNNNTKVSSDGNTLEVANIEADTLNPKTSNVKTLINNNYIQNSASISGVSGDWIQHTYKGNYTKGTEYKVSDIITYTSGGSIQTYCCKTDHTADTDAPTPANWDAITPTVYSDNKIYSNGDFVTYNSNYYKYVIANVSNKIIKINNNSPDSSSGAKISTIYTTVGGSTTEKTTIESDEFKGDLVGDVNGIAAKANIIDASISGDTANYKTLKNALLDMIYPVGSIYMSMRNASPALFLGGTWEEIGNGRVLMTSDYVQVTPPSGTNFSTSPITYYTKSGSEYSPVTEGTYDPSAGITYYSRSGNTGGSSSVLLQSNQIPTLTSESKTISTADSDNIRLTNDFMANAEKKYYDSDGTEITNPGSSGYVQYFTKNTYTYYTALNPQPEIGASVEDYYTYDSVTSTYTKCPEGSVAEQGVTYYQEESYVAYDRVVSPEVAQSAGTYYVTTDQETYTEVSKDQGDRLVYYEYGDLTGWFEVNRDDNGENIVVKSSGIVTRSEGDKSSGGVDRDVTDRVTTRVTINANHNHAVTIPSLTVNSNSNQQQVSLLQPYVTCYMWERIE